MGRTGILGIAAMAGLAGLISLSGCGQDCLDAKRLGDFEFSQANFPNAIRHYERALAADPACAGVKERLEEAKARKR